MMLCASGRTTLAGWRQFATYITILVAFAQAVLTGGRGPFFSTSAVICVGYALATKRKIPLFKAFIVLGCVAVGVLLMLGYRNVLRLGEDRPEAPGIIEALSAMTRLDENAQSTSTTGNEFIFHGAALETVDRKQKYALGLNWIYVFTLGPIPRIIWPEKPYRFEAPGIHWDDILEVTGLAVLGDSVMNATETYETAMKAMGRNAASGATPGIVADLYIQFGLFSAVAFYLMGRGLRRLYISAASLDSPLLTCSYIMLYSLSLNVFTQELYAVLVPFTFAIGPVMLFQLLRTRRRVGHRIAPVARSAGVVVRAGALPEIRSAGS